MYEWYKEDYSIDLKNVTLSELESYSETQGIDYKNGILNKLSEYAENYWAYIREKNALNSEN